MTAPPTPAFRLALAASLALLAGCGGEPSINDTAETVRPDPAKTSPAPEPTKSATEPTPAPPPDATPTKDAPKG